MNGSKSGNGSDIRRMVNVGGATILALVIALLLVTNIVLYVGLRHDLAQFQTKLDSAADDASSASTDAAEAADEAREAHSAAQDAKDAAEAVQDHLGA